MRITHTSASTQPCVAAVTTNDEPASLPATEGLSCKSSTCSCWLASLTAASIAVANGRFPTMAAAAGGVSPVASFIVSALLIPAALATLRHVQTASDLCAHLASACSEGEGADADGAEMDRSVRLSLGSQWAPRWQIKYVKERPQRVSHNLTVASS